MSDIWLHAFLNQRDQDATAKEAAFIASFLRPGSRVLDLACGYGRHAGILTALGHSVFGLDRDIRVLPRAREKCSVVQAEMRHPPFSEHSFDAVLSMWQSFGYFSAEENANLLRELARMTKPNGVLILDLYNRQFFETVGGERQFERAGVAVRETTILQGDRLKVELRYGDGEVADQFEWQLYTPNALQMTAASCGWTLTDQFRDFDITCHANEHTPRIQYVLRRSN